MGWIMAVLELLIIFYLVRKADKLVKINYYIANMYMQAALLKYKKIDDLVDVIYEYVNIPDNEWAKAAGMNMSKDLGLQANAYNNKNVFTKTLKQRLELIKDPLSLL